MIAGPPLRGVGMMLALFLSALAIAACSEPQPEEAAETVAGPTVYPVADGGPATGVFEISTEDGGTVIVQEVLADGTYRNTLDGTVLETGTWRTPERGMFCTTSNGKTSCDEESLAPDGTWISINVEDPTSRWIIRRLEESSEPPTA